MRNTEKYAGKRVLVVGMARSGIAAAQLLCKAGARIIINDSKAAEQLGDSLKPLEICRWSAVWAARRWNAWTASTQWSSAPLCRTTRRSS